MIALGKETKKLKYGGKPDPIWMAKITFTLELSYQKQNSSSLDNTESILINLVRDIGLDISKNKLYAVDWGDGEYEVVENFNADRLNHEYRPKSNSIFRNSRIVSEYNVILYLKVKRGEMYPTEKIVGNIDNGYKIVTKNIVFADRI